mgnify:CR=1 FL=1
MSPTFDLLYFGDVGHPWHFALAAAVGRAGCRLLAATDRRTEGVPIQLVTRATVLKVAEQLAERRNDGAPVEFVVADRNCRPFEWELRELGAADIWFSPREADEVIRTAQRLPVEPTAETSLHATLFARLPWDAADSLFRNPERNSRP